MRSGVPDPPSDKQTGPLLVAGLVFVGFLIIGFVLRNADDSAKIGRVVWLVTSAAVLLDYRSTGTGVLAEHAADRVPADPAVSETPTHLLTMDQSSNDFSARPAARADRHRRGRRPDRLRDRRRRVRVDGGVRGPARGMARGESSFVAIEIAGRATVSVDVVKDRGTQARGSTRVRTTCASASVSRCRTRW
jgi:hypothetical protein